MRGVMQRVAPVTLRQLVLVLVWIYAISATKRFENKVFLAAVYFEAEIQIITLAEKFLQQKYHLWRRQKFLLIFGIGEESGDWRWLRGLDITFL